VAVDVKNRAPRVGPEACPSDGDDDARLAEWLMQGRPEAAVLAWRRFYPMVETTLRRMLGPGGDLQDLAQEVFLRFFVKVGTLRKVESLRPFVMAIAVRRAQEEIKRRRVRRWFAPLLGETLHGSGTVEVDHEHREAILHLYQAIDRLGVTDRGIYLLRYVEGLEQAQIAQTLGISLSTVRRRLVRLTARVSEMVREDSVLMDFVQRARGGLGRSRRWER
jgi:RNA polymerase sigma-70 factor (ECF subfamily)